MSEPTIQLMQIQVYIMMEGNTVELVWMPSDIGEPGVVLLSNTTVQYTRYRRPDWRAVLQNTDNTIQDTGDRTGGKCYKIQTTLYLILENAGV